MNKSKRRDQEWRRGGDGGKGEEEGGGRYLTSAFLNWALSSGGMLLSSTLNCDNGEEFCIEL